jgi:membrane protein implicated in regulation of membrane protease activity
VEWWVWLAVGLVLLVVELATPSGFFVMFFGVGALTVGLVTALALVEAAWAQWLAFIVLSVAYLLLFRDRMRGVDRPPANIDTLVGELAIPRERILPGQFGRVDLRGTLWNARNDASAHLEPGQRCRVTGVDEGLVVFVQPE